MRPLFDLRCFYVVVCLLTTVSTHIIVAEEPIADPTAAAAPEPELTSEQRVAANEEKLTRPVKVELKKGLTLREAIERIAQGAELKVEYEAATPLVIKEFYGQELTDDLTLDSDDFESALNDLGTQYVRSIQGDSESEQNQNVLWNQYVAAPTRNGVLISNTFLRMNVPCRMETEIYDVSDFTSFERPLPPLDLINLIEQHVMAIWSISGAGEHEPDTFYNPSTDKRERFDPDWSFAVCRMNYLSSQRVVVIKAPRTVHYEVSRLLESIRAKVREREKQPAAPKPSTTTY